MATARYTPPVQGKPTDIHHGTRVRLQEEARKEMTEQAVEFVDINPTDQWIHMFILTTTGYALTSCGCLIPTVTCRAEGEMEYRTVPSTLTVVLMEDLKMTMGEQNCRILNRASPTDRDMGRGGARRSQDPTTPRG